MQLSKIYLESSVFNYFIDEDRDAHIDTVTLFNLCQQGKFEPFTSTYTIQELLNTPDSYADKRNRMLSLIKEYNIHVLAANDDSDTLAARYITEGAMSSASIADSSHIAIASLNDMDAIISLNFKHIVKERVKRITGAVNEMLGLKKLQILTPMEVLDSEQTNYPDF